MVLNGNVIPAQEYENDENMYDGSVSDIFVDIRGATPGMSPINSSSHLPNVILEDISIFCQYLVA